MKYHLKKWLMPILLIFLIPHITNLVSCYMMNQKQLNEIPMAVYVGDNSALTREIVKSFDDTDTFNIVEYALTPQDVERSMERGESLYGLIIPKNFTLDLKNEKSPTILTMIDGTQLSSAAFTKLKGVEALLEIKEQILIDTFKAKFDISDSEALHIAAPMNINNRILGNPTRNYINFVMPGIIASLIQIGIAMTTASLLDPTIVGIKNFLIDYFKKLGVYSVLGLCSILLMVFVQVVFFDVPFKGNFMGLISLVWLFTTTVVAISMMSSIIFYKNRVFATQVAAVYFIPSTIISGYTWPLVAMPKPIQNLSVILPFKYFGDFIRAWLVQGYYRDYQTSVFALLIMIVVSFLVSLVFYKFWQVRLVKGGIQN